MSNAMLSSLTGMLAHQQLLDITSNNLANSETPGFKSARAEFSDVLYNLNRPASAPTGVRGGVNPDQVGVGTRVNGTLTNFKQGPTNLTGRDMDVAIDGPGFFKLRAPSGAEFFTRVGSFAFDSGAVDTGVQRLVELNTGYLVENTLGQPIELVKTIPGQATSTIRIEGNLAPAVDNPLSGERLTGLFTLKQANGSSVSVGTKLADTSLFQGAAPATDTTLHIAGTEADGTPFGFSVPLPASTNIRDFVSKLNSGLSKPVTQLDSKGQPVIGSDGNPVTTIQTFGLVRFEGGTLVAEPTVPGGKFSFFLGETAPPTAAGGGAPTKTQLNDWQHTNGVQYDWDRVRFTPESVPSQMTVVTADGTTHELSGRWFATGINANQGRTWDFVFDSPAGGSLAADSRSIRNVTFNSDGSLNFKPAVTLNSTWNAGGALQFSVDAAAMLGRQGASFVDATDPTGYPSGTLDSMAFNAAGQVIGSYSNGRTQPMSATNHQLGLALFANPSGLMNQGGNLWASSQNSGQPLDATPGANDLNGIIAGALEGSNVDVATEFTRLIVAQRAFQSSSKSFQVADELLRTATELVR
jgi:flagellar hook protein FlgE